MARPTLDFPTRILAIAVVIAVLLAGLVWMLSGVGAPAPTPAEAEPDDETAVLAPGEVVEPGAAGDALPETPIEAGDQVSVQLYLAQAGSRELVPRPRRILAPDHPAARAQVAVQALINAGEPGYASPLPPGTTVREVWVDVENGVAYVDFSRGFQGLLGGGSLTEIHAVYGVVGTLTASLPEIERVQFLVDGRPVDTLTGHLDMTGPIGPSRDWLR